MQKNQTLFLILISILSLGQNCFAMYRHPFPYNEQDVVLPMYQERVQRNVNPSIPVAGKHCLCDGLKMTVGGSIAAACFLGLFTEIAGCGAPRESMSPTGKFICDGPGAFALMSGASAAGLYTLYHMIKFSVDSWYLKKIIQNKIFNSLERADQSEQGNYQN